MKILDRYVLKEFLASFFMTVGVFSFILVLNNLLLMMDLFLNRGVALSTIFRLLGLALPMLLPMSVPMGSLLACLLACGRLAEDGELTALKSLGVAPSVFSRAIFIFTLCLSLGLLFFNHEVAPRSAQQFQNLYQELARQNPLALFVPKILHQFGDYKIIVDEMDRSKNQLRGITIYKVNPEGNPTRILAPNGVLSADEDHNLIFELKDGTVHQPSTEKNSEYAITKFTRMALRVSVSLPTSTREPAAREMTTRELYKTIAQSSGETRSTLKTEANFRTAIAFAPFVLSFFGVGMGQRLKRGAKAISVGSSLVVILCYYGLSLLAFSLGSSATLPPVLLSWMANLTVLAVSLFLWKKASA